MSRSLVGNTLLYLPAQLLGPLAQFLVIVAWTHLLDPASFGVATFIVAAQELTATGGYLWWTLYFLRFNRRYESDGAELLQEMDRRMVVWGAATQLLVAPFVLLVIGVTPQAADTVAVAAYLLTRMLIAHYSERARAEHRIAAYTYAQLLGPLCGAGLSLVAIWRFGPTPAAALTGLALGQAIGAVGLMAALKIRPGLGAFDADVFRRAGRFGAPLVVSGLFGWLAVNGVRILVSAGEGVAGVGMLSAGWGLGQRLANMLAMLCTAAAFPIAIDKLEAGDRGGALEQVSLNSALMLGLLAPASAGVALLAKPLVGLLISANFYEVTIVTLPIATLAGALRMLKIHVADQCSLLLERMRAQMALNLADLAMTLGAAAIGMYFGGVIGAAIGCCIGTAFGALTSVCYAVFALGLPFHSLVYARILAAVALMSAVIAACPAAQGAVALTIQVLLGATAYGASVFALFPEVRAFARARIDTRGARSPIGVRRPANQDM
ncbi:MAG: lipopolysaccharide biosynthesis protein [Hyphomicrobiales bacterium]|nr:lipopolysaccharide biosynthesis protein [Hyphomicrobiales bacterium]